MRQKSVLGILLIVTALAVLAQNFTSKPPGAPTLTDRQRIERLERQVSALQARLTSLELQSRTQIRPLDNSK